MNKGYKVIDRRGIDVRRREVRRLPRPGGGTGAGRELALSSWGTYATPRNSGQMDYYRPRVYLVGSNEVVNDFDWLELLSYSRQLFAQIGDIAGAVLQKNMYAVGDAFRPQYLGRNEKWGQEATEWLLEVWYPQSDMRGGVFDFNVSLFLSGVSWDVDGDDAEIFAVDPDTGFPYTKQISAWSIGSSGGTENEIKGGEFDGAKLANGIILDRNDRFLGIRIRGGESGVDQDVPAVNCHLGFEPEWATRFRGIPRLGRCLLDELDGQEIDIFLKRGVKLDSSIGALRTVVGGEPPPGGEIGSGAIVVPRGSSTDSDTAMPTQVSIERLGGGEIYYLQAGMDEKLEPFTSERPHPNVEAFVTRLKRRSMLGLRWFFELLDPSKIGGASVRMIQDEARHAVMDRQKFLIKRARRRVQFALAQAMKTGRISRNEDGIDFMRWGFNLPALLTVDAGYDEQADRENLLLGTTTLAAVCEKKGKYYREVREQRKSENKLLINEAIELMKYAQEQGQTLSFGEALAMQQGKGAVSGARTAEKEIGTKEKTEEKIEEGEEAE